MSTRAVIKIIEKLENVKTPRVVTLYHHYDGYPEYLGKFLIENLTNTICNDYVLKEELCDIDRLSNFLLKNKDDEGFEYTCYIHVDIEYLYTININEQTITCQKVYYKDWNINRYTIDKTINLKEYLEKETIYA